MALDPDILEQSFDLVAADGDRLMDEFYARLFAAAPVVRGLFPHDLARQKRKLLEALVLLRVSLRRLDSLAPALRELGARHARYGARAEHYPVVGAALIASMRAVAGTAWREEYDVAWERALWAVASAMLDGAAEASAAA
jgi:hemoglobin-like flavoprotein